MKLVYSFFFVVFGLNTALLAQDKLVFQPNSEIRIKGILPSAFGENMLSEAHNPKLGWGISTSPFSIYNIKLGFGFDFTRFETTDFALAGNVDRSELLNFYGYLAYPLDITDKIALEPKVGIGGNKLRQKLGEKDFGNMKGTSFLFGTSLEYEIAYPLEFFLGADFVKTKFKVESHPNNQNFFENANQFNIYLGLKFNLMKRKKESD